MLLVQAQGMLLVVDLVFFDRLVFVIEAEQRSNAESEHDAQQEEYRSGSHCQRQFVGNHDKAVRSYFSSDGEPWLSQDKLRAHVGGGPFLRPNTCFTGVPLAPRQELARLVRLPEASVP